MEARLERSQAEAKSQRAQQRLDDFLAEQPTAQVRPVRFSNLMHSHPLLLMHPHAHQDVVQRDL